MEPVYHPRTNVSFAPTPPFVQRYPDEVAEQVEKLTTRTWALKAASVVAVKEELPAFVPDQLFEKITSDEELNPLVDAAQEQKNETVDKMLLLLAGIFCGAVITYYVSRWIDK